MRGKDAKTNEDDVFSLKVKKEISLNYFNFVNDSKFRHVTLVRFDEIVFKEFLEYSGQTFKCRKRKVDDERKK